MSGQNLPNFPPQLIERERFWQKIHTSVQHAVVDDRVARIAGRLRCGTFETSRARAFKAQVAHSDADELVNSG